MNRCFKFCTVVLDSISFHNLMMLSLCVNWVIKQFSTFYGYTMSEIWTFLLCFVCCELTVSRVFLYAVKHVWRGSLKTWNTWRQIRTHPCSLGKCFYFSFLVPQTVKSESVWLQQYGVKIKMNSLQNQMLNRQKNSAACNFSGIKDDDEKALTNFTDQ